MAAISFKNVGQKSEDVNRQKAAARVDTPPLGVVTPVRSGDDSEGIFKMHYKLADQIRDNFRNLLLTNHGDRVVLYDFGTNLLPLTFELTSQENFDSEAMIRIKTAVEKYMPFITLVDFESNINFPNEPLSTGRVDVKIRYDVSGANIKNDSITVTFFLGG